MDTKTSFRDLYSFPGFRASARLKLHPEHPGARMTTLKRRQKKLFVRVDRFITAGTTVEFEGFVILIPAQLRFIWSLKFAVSTAIGVRP